MFGEGTSSADDASRTNSGAKSPGVNLHETIAQQKHAIEKLERQRQEQSTSFSEFETQFNAELSTVQAERTQAIKDKRALEKANAALKAQLDELQAAHDELQAMQAVKLRPRRVKTPVPSRTATTVYAADRTTTLEQQLLHAEAHIAEIEPENEALHTAVEAAVDTITEQEQLILCLQQQLTDQEDERGSLSRQRDAALAKLEAAAQYDYGDEAVDTSLESLDMSMSLSAELASTNGAAADTSAELERLREEQAAALAKKEEEMAELSQTLQKRNSQDQAAKQAEAMRKDNATMRNNIIADIRAMMETTQVLEIIYKQCMGINNLLYPVNIADSKAKDLFKSLSTTDSPDEIGFVNRVKSIVESDSREQRLTLANSQPFQESLQALLDLWKKTSALEPAEDTSSATLDECLHTCKNAVWTDKVLPLINDCFGFARTSLNLGFTHYHPEVSKSLRFFAVKQVFSAVHPADSLGLNTLTDNTIKLMGRCGGPDDTDKTSTVDSETLSKLLIESQAVLPIITSILKNADKNPNKTIRVQVQSKEGSTKRKKVGQFEIIQMLVKQMATLSELPSQLQTHQQALTDKTKQVVDSTAEHATKQDYFAALSLALIELDNYFYKEIGLQDYPLIRKDRNQHRDAYEEAMAYLNKSIQSGALDNETLFNMIDDSVTGFIERGESLSKMFGGALLAHKNPALHATSSTRTTPEQDTASGANSSNPATPTRSPRKASMLPQMKWMTSTPPRRRSPPDDTANQSNGVSPHNATATHSEPP